MDPFNESELFDEDMPAASPLSIEEEPTETLGPSATGGWSALPAALARRWPACVAALLVALLALVLLTGVRRTHSRFSAPDRAHAHDDHRPGSRSRRQSRRFTNSDRTPNALATVSSAHPTRDQQTVVITPSQPPSRPSRRPAVGRNRPGAHVGDGNTGQFDYLGR